MSCLALSLQPSDGSDILLQTREWFPPARALVALSAFRNTRLAFSSLRQQQQNNQQQLKKKHSSSSSAPSLTEEIDSALGDDPLAASSGQVIVGVESQYLVVYRLVNGVYVLGITTADHRHNVFDCINTVNQAVNVIVAACRGVDVTPEKIHRKYPEVYMALDIVLRGVGAVRLAAILGSLHGDSVAKMLQAGIDSEIRVRGADSWVGGAEISSIERKSTLEAFSNATFELPPETLAVGDEVAAAIAPPSQQMEEQKTKDEVAEESYAEKDPFAASDVVNKPMEENLVGGFKKTKDVTASGGGDLTLALAGLDVTVLPPAAASKSTFVAVEGFEGEYGGVEFGKEEASLSEAFEVFDDSFGGGLDASEFVETKKKKPERQGLGGVELLLLTQQSAPPTANGGDPSKSPLDNLMVTKSADRKGPEMQIVEEISAEFRESLLARVALQGTVYLRTLPPKKSDGGGKETEFSFKFGTTAGVKRVAMQRSCITSLGNRLFHVKTPSINEPIPVLRYSLQPRLTPVPLRVRLTQRHTGTLLSVMIQYASNPELPHPLTNVTFVLKLPVDPTLLTVSPKAQLNREERELRWVVPDIPLTGSPGKLRARMPVDQDAEKGEDAVVVGMVVFSAQGGITLSGVSLQPATEGSADVFYTVDHSYSSKSYVCN